MCHGSLIFTTLSEKLKGRELTAYMACCPEVESMGAMYISEHLNNDGNLVFGQAWPDVPMLMKEFIKKLNG